MTSDYVPMLFGDQTILVSPSFLMERDGLEAERRKLAFGNFSKAVRMATGQPLEDNRWGSPFTSAIESGAFGLSRTLDKPRDTPDFGFLRQMRRRSPIDQLIISTRLAQVRHLAKRSPNPKRVPGWRVRHRYADDPNFTNSDDIQRRCMATEIMIERSMNTAWQQGGFKGSILSMVEDELVLDRKVIGFDAVDSKGRPHGWHLLDPTCYSDDTEVLTRTGWKRFADVDIEADEFATRNQITHEFEWQKAFYKHEADWDHLLHHFKSRTVDILVTENHRMLVDSLPRAYLDRSHGPAGEAFIRADDLARYMTAATRLPATSVWNAPDMEYFEWPSRSTLPKPLLERLTGDQYAAFMGMYLAEGCVSAIGTPKRDRIMISQLPESKGYEPYRTLLKEILGREPSHDGRVFYFKCQAFADYLKQFGHAREKHLPDEVKNLSARQLGIFWEFYWLGDGHVHRGQCGATTSSQRLAGDLQEILQKIGLSAGVTAVEPCNDSRMKDGRIIHKESKGTKYIVGVRASTHQHFSHGVLPYSGKVYCVSVPNEVLYVRRNGKPSWCGNTIKPVLDSILPYVDQVAAAKGWSQAQVVNSESLLREAQERMSERTGIDFVDAAYVQEIEGRAVQAWKADEMVVDIVYPSTELNRWGYGSSPLEMSMWWSLSFNLAVQYNADIFKPNYPESLLFLFGDYDPEGLEAFRKQVLGDSPGGVNGRLPIVAGGENMKAEIHKLRETPRDMLFSQWIKMLTAYKAAAYRMNPEVVNFNLVTSSDQTLFQKRDSTNRMTLSQEEGLFSILESLGDFITRALVQPWYDDLVFEWVGLSALSEQDETAMLVSQLNYATVNEIRAKTGELDDLEGEDAEMGNRLLNAAAIQLQTAENSNKIQQQQVNIQKDAAKLAAAAPQGGGGSAAGQRAIGGNPAEQAPPSAGGRPHNTRIRKEPAAKPPSAPS